LTGSIRAVLPVAFFSINDLTSLVGGLAAAIAIGAFGGQALDTLRPRSELRRRRFIALGGFIGLMGMIGLFLVSAKSG
jgi:hypothetical protein